MGTTSVTGDTDTDTAAAGGFLTAAEVAALLRCSTVLACRLAKTGRVTARKARVGRTSHWRFTRADVDAYVRGQSNRRPDA